MEKPGRECQQGGLETDPIAEVRDAINQEYLDGLQQGKERGGWIYENNTTGEYVTQPDLNAVRDACEIATLPTARPLAGHTPRSSYHTHVLGARTDGTSGLRERACRNTQGEWTQPK